MRNLKFMLVAAFAALFIACGSSAPKDVAMDFSKAMIEGKTKKLVSMIYLPEKYKNHSDEVEGKLMQMTARVKSQVEAKGGFDRIEFVEEQIQEDKATVKLKIHFKDGSSEDERVRLIKSDGKWKVNMK